MKPRRLKNPTRASKPRSKLVERVVIEVRSRSTTKAERLVEGIKRALSRADSVEVRQNGKRGLDAAVYLHDNDGRNMPRVLHISALYELAKLWGVRIAIRSRA